MTQQPDQFITLVKESRVLSTEQKALLLDGPVLPEAYQQTVVHMLQEFDKNSRARESYLRDKMEELYTEFITQLDTEKIGEDIKKELKEKAQKQIASFFPTLSSV